jgi:hypothetical protein
VPVDNGYSCKGRAVGLSDLPSKVDQLTFIAGLAKFVNKILCKHEFGGSLHIAVEGPPRGLLLADTFFTHLVVPHDSVGRVMTLTLTLQHTLGPALGVDQSSCPRYHFLEPLL